MVYADMLRQTIHQFNNRYVASRGSLGDCRYRQHKGRPLATHDAHHTVVDALIMPSCPNPYIRRKPVPAQSSNNAAAWRTIYAPCVVCVGDGVLPFQQG